MILWILILSFLILPTDLFEYSDAQVGPLYGDPEVLITFERSLYETSFENNFHVVQVKGTVTCMISTSAPDGTKVRVNLHLSDEFEYDSDKYVDFEKPEEMEKEFSFRYQRSGDLNLGAITTISLSGDWEYLDPDEGSGYITPVTASVQIGSYCDLGIERVKPSGPVSLDVGKWKTIELMITNDGNDEVTVRIAVNENPSEIEIDIFKGWVIVGPFSEFPISFTIRGYENREIDSYFTIKATAIAYGEKSETEHKIPIMMEKEPSLIDFGGVSLWYIVPFFTLAFFGVMFLFWARLVWMRRKSSNEEIEEDVIRSQGQDQSLR